MPWRRQPILARFLGDQRLRRFRTDSAVADAALDPLGPLMPVRLLQLIGPAVALHTGETCAPSRPVHGLAFLRRIVEAGKTAIWSYDAEGVLPRTTSGHAAGRGTPLTTEQDANAPARRDPIMLDEGLVAAAQDIDPCLIMGGQAVPPGGITPYLDRIASPRRSPAESSTDLVILALRDDVSER
jgi:hypothetical protein